MGNNGLERKPSKIHAFGLFTTRDFKIGERVYVYPVGRKVFAAEVASLSAEEQDRLEKRGEGVYELMQPPACFVNHSCDPNVTEKDHDAYALRDIKVGEEITADYSEGMEGSMQCNCGNKNCKKIIGGIVRTIIVDENDKVVGYKNRDEIELSDIYRVMGLWITNSKGDILLAQRSMNKKNDPGRWGPAVAGTVEEGETYDSNIVKEAFEELGLKDVQPMIGPKVRMSGMHQYWLQWYSLVVDKQIEYFKPEPKEVMAIKWFVPSELKRDFEKDATLFLKGAPRWIELFCK